MSRVLKQNKPKTVNSELIELEQNEAIVERIQKRTSTIRKQITDSFRECVLMFVDLVDSTIFKQNHDDFSWILRVKIFVDVIREYAEKLGGDVVKVIGDEVMIAFNRDEMVNDAISFVIRVSEIENALKRISKFETKIKVALDIGSVCFIKYEGHDTPDPQGTPVDRCARISKYCEASTVLTSESLYNRFEHKSIWHFIGKPYLKGIGNVSIYQLNKKTVNAENKKVITESEFDLLCKAKTERDDFLLKNIELQKQIDQLGGRAKESNRIDTGKKKSWEDIDVLINEVKDLIKKAPIPDDQYARFLFLNEINEGEEYNKYENKVFDESIRAGFVKKPDYNVRFFLDKTHKRNQRVIEKLVELEDRLKVFVGKYGNIDGDDLFEYSLSSPEFWEKYLGYHVL